MKITGGCLKVKMVLTNRKEQYSNKHFDSREKAEDWEEKVDQIRIYSGVKYEAVEEAVAGTICAVTGLSKTYPGEGLGIETVSDMPILEPVLNYQVLLPSDCDAHVMLSKLRLLEEEDPQLHIVWSEHLKEIHVQLMGEIQIEILKSLIMERFGVAVEFGEGNILYKETILDQVEGVGHFEPLRHYAEVHLIMEPGDPGSGLQFYSSCSEDELDRNWQRLILTHLAEKEHIGVLTGSPITDMRITLIAGRAHLKHTEGGDFRQATYRAVRQGLKKANCILLEPYYSFRLEIPSDLVGRAMSDISRMYGSFQTPETEGEWSVLVGKAPVATMRGYQMEVASYTRGRGKLFCTLKGYEACHNQDEVVAAIGYDSERDLENPTGSVFCAHGAGFVVPWNEVERYQHIESGLDLRLEKQQELQTKAEQEKEAVHVRRAPLIGGSLQEDKELEEIFTRTFGPIKNKTYPSQNSLGYEKKSTYVERKQGEQFKTSALTKEYLLVDGYNIIFAWDELNELAKENMDAARYKLMDILCNYQGFKKCILILVFDAYKVKGGVGSVTNYHGIHVVYTKEAETADMYIEKVTHEIGRRHHITVATSDYVEQIIIMGQGALRLSAQELKVEIARVNEQIRSEYLAKQVPGRNYLGNHMNGELLQNHVDEDGDSLHISS